MLARRRRRQHLRRRRRDLLEDVSLAFVFTILLLSLTAGLGVVTIVDLVVGLGLVASVLVERRYRRRPKQGVARTRTTRQRRR